MLRDVDGLTYREIAEHLDLPISASAREIGDYSKIYKIVVRGRGILERVWSKEGWREKADAMKAEAMRWYSLTPEERVVEECAELLGVSPQEAQRMLLDNEIDEELDDRQQIILVASKISYYRAVQQQD